MVDSSTLLDGLTYNSIRIHLKSSIERYLERLTLGDVVDRIGKMLSIYELIGLATSPHCQGCGQKKVFVLGFDFCLNCKDATSRLFIAF